MSQLGKRLLSSAFLVSISIGTIFYAPMWFYLIIVEVIVLVSLNEFFMLAEKKNIQVNRMIGLFFGACLPLAFLFHSDSMILVLACLAVFMFNFPRHLMHQAIVSTSVTMFGLIYIAWFFSHLIYLRQLDLGAQWVFFTVLVVKGGDAGAYFTGKAIGKTKLIEHVSPKKTVEGAVGGWLTSIVLAIVSGFYLPGVSFWSLLILGASVSIISQLGDLSESLIKRDAGVKDSGVIPGLGGALDVMDSLLLTIPFVFYYVTSLRVFTG
jgi:phosphatidate cytidylyltransferase